MNPGERIVSYCGIVCSECSAYLATQSGDAAELERVAASWQDEYRLDHVTTTDVSCDGCVTAGRKAAHCLDCEIRACAQALAVQTCAHCHYYSCEKLERLFELAPKLRDNLDQIEATL
jgi:hypothetical protein